MKVWLALIFTGFVGFIFASEVTVVTLAVGENYQQTVHAGIENKESYCQLHGYDFICGKDTLSPKRPISWSKIPLILKVMKETSCQWIFWSDADALIMNFNIAIEELIDQDYHFIVTQDFNDINMGHFLIRNCEWSQRFLEKVYSRTEFIHHPWWEQMAVIQELRQNEEWRAFTRIIPQRAMNSYCEEILLPCRGFLDPQEVYQPGDFVLHFAGARDLQLLRSLFEKYVPLAITGYVSQEAAEQILSKPQ